MQGVTSESRASIGSSGLQPRILYLAAVFSVVLACVAQDGKPVADSAAAAAQAANARAQQASDKAQIGVARESERKKQIADESAQLLNMALALKAEVDKTTKDTLSLNVIRKADQIERLAKSVRGR